MPGTQRSTRGGKSTDVPAAAGQPPPADPAVPPSHAGQVAAYGDRTLGFSGEDGEDIPNLVDYAESGGVTVVTIPGRVFSHSKIPNTDVVGKNLLYRPGQVVPLAEVQRLQAAADAARKAKAGPTETADLPPVETKE